MFSVIKDNALAKVKVARGEKSWVQLAVKDLKKDLNHLKKDNSKKGQLKSTINVCSLENKKAKLPIDITLPTKKEGFSITIKTDAVYIVGYDDFGELPFNKFMVTDMNIRWCIEGIYEPGKHDAQVVHNTLLQEQTATKAIEGFERRYNEFKNIKGLDVQQQRLLNTIFITWCKIFHDIYSVTYNYYKMSKAKAQEEILKHAEIVKRER